MFAYDTLLLSHGSGNGFIKPLLDQSKLVIKKTPREALERADLCVLAHPRESWNLKEKDFRSMAQPLIFNPWQNDL